MNLAMTTSVWVLNALTNNYQNVFIFSILTKRLNGANKIQALIHERFCSQCSHQFGNAHIYHKNNSIVAHPCVV
jgi:hypothetical protein